MALTVKDYLDNRAKATIERVESKPKPYTKPSSSKMPNHELYDTLKTWRNDKAEDLGVDQYMILPQKALLQLVSQLPYNAAELKAIKGIGKKKLQQFGSEILEIIIDYRIDNGIETPKTQLEIEEILPKKNAKVDSKKVSFDLFNQGKTIDTIAAERSMSKMTIERSFSTFCRYRRP